MCSFECHSKTTGDVLKIFHYASRGKFLNTPWKNAEKTYYASWLNPTHEWFSLSMYLVSRFEVALQQSYLWSVQKTPCEIVQTYHFGLDQTKVWKNCILNSMRTNSIYHLRSYCDHKNEDFRIRDCIWYQLLEENDFTKKLFDQNSSNDDDVPINILLDNVITIRLLEIGTGYDIFKKTLCSILYEYIVTLYSEKCLLSSFSSNLENINDDSKILMKNSNKNSNKNRNNGSKKKKKGKIKKKMHSVSNATTLLHVFFTFIILSSFFLPPLCKEEVKLNISVIFCCCVLL